MPESAPCAPLRIVKNRRSLRKEPKPKYRDLPWIMRCGCGLRSRCVSFDRGLFILRNHRCGDFHP